MNSTTNPDSLPNRRGPQRSALKQLQDALNDLRSAAFEFHTMLPRHCQTQIRLQRRRIRPAARRIVDECDVGRIIRISRVH